MPLTVKQLAALTRATTWQLAWGLPRVAAELRRWRVQALRIPDNDLRADALHALDSKRGHTDGAALFWTLTRRRRPELLRLLVAYEVIYDYLDNLSERSAAQGDPHGQHLFLALVDSVAPGRTPADYYQHCSWHADGGYLRLLVETCRAGCRRLPGFTTAQPFLELEAAHTSVLASNHITDPHVRDETLQRWSTAHVAPGIDSLAWYERTAAASQSVVTFALLATAAEPTTSPEAVRSVYEAYYPWFAYAVTMLDSWVDRAEDEASGAHSYIAHYTDSEQAVSRLCESAARSAESLLSLPHGQRHAVLLACMIAMYLSKNSVRGFEGRAPARRIAEAGGSLTLCLLPVLRLWRICNGQTDAT